MDEETIVALATAPFPSGIAVVRVSGKDAGRALRCIFRSKEDPLKDPRRMVFGKIIDGHSGEVIDHGFAVFMQAPASYTGEDVVEFQFHGSPLVAEKIVGTLLGAGIRMAEAGEFTKRAFLNGKLDLLQAEAVADLINAGSERALRVAEEQIEGRFSRTVAEIAEPLRNILAELEASIDFPEEDILPAARNEFRHKIGRAVSDIDVLLDTYRYGIVLREGFRVLICGGTNVGKSTLFNRFLGRPRAIVTDISGTTRDVLEEHVLIDGRRFVLCDSAGIRKSSDAVEQIGISLAMERLEWADLILVLVDAAQEIGNSAAIFRRLQEFAGKCWLVLNKIDLLNGSSPVAGPLEPFSRSFAISAFSGEGMEELSEALLLELEKRLPSQSEGSVVVANERQRDCLSRAREALYTVSNVEAENAPLEILCAGLWTSLQALEEIVGKTYSEDILGRIFMKFCIGK